MLLLYTSTINILQPLDRNNLIRFQKLPPQAKAAVHPTVHHSESFKQSIRCPSRARRIHCLVSSPSSCHPLEGQVMARIYAGANAQLGRSWYDYGE
jgi:hypothetical protein